MEKHALYWKWSLTISIRPSFDNRQFSHFQSSPNSYVNFFLVPSCRNSARRKVSFQRWALAHTTCQRRARTSCQEWNSSLKSFTRLASPWKKYSGCRWIKNGTKWQNNSRCDTLVSVCTHTYQFACLCACISRVRVHAHVSVFTCVYMAEGEIIFFPSYLSVF